MRVLEGIVIVLASIAAFGPLLAALIIVMFELR